MAGQEWSWRVKVSATDDADVHRLDVNVYADKDHKDSLASMVAYTGRPAAGAAATGQPPQ
jgi:hypothetical protein